MNKSESFNPIEVQKYLKGISFPASKDKIINCVRENGAPDKLINEIMDIDKKEYSSPTEISKQLANY